MGDTDFNLREIARALGAQNPEWSIAERITPVLVVGELQGLTPAHVPPTSQYGGIIAAAAGQFAAIQVASRGEGGTWVQAHAQALVIVHYRLFATDQTGAWGAVTTAIDAGPFAPLPSRAIVEFGTAVAVLNPNTTPFINAAGLAQILTTSRQEPAVWVPPGSFLVFASNTVNNNLNWGVSVTDVPVAEGGR